MATLPSAFPAILPATTTPRFTSCGFLSFTRQLQPRPHRPLLQPPRSSSLLSSNSSVIPPQQPYFPSKPLCHAAAQRAVLSSLGDTCWFFPAKYSPHVSCHLMQRSGLRNHPQVLFLSSIHTGPQAAPCPLLPISALVPSCTAPASSHALYPMLPFLS